MDIQTKIAFTPDSPAHLSEAVVVVLKKNNPTERNPERYAVAYWDGRHYNRWLKSKGYRVIASRGMSELEKQEFKDCNRFIYWKYKDFESVIKQEYLYSDVLQGTWYKKLNELKTIHK